MPLLLKRAVHLRTGHPFASLLQCSDGTKDLIAVIGQFIDFSLQLVNTCLVVLLLRFAF